MRFQGYVPTERSTDALARILLALKNPNAHRAWTMTGFMEPENRRLLSIWRVCVRPKILEYGGKRWRSHIGVWGK
ncbi:MAG: hypothetical protein LRZ84_05310 [Desertifilum sp.]|nr:hypothetical protein [Desertifilum sp.]